MIRRALSSSPCLMSYLLISSGKRARQEKVRTHLGDSGRNIIPIRVRMANKIWRAIGKRNCTSELMKEKP